MAAREGMAASGAMPRGSGGGERWQWEAVAARGRDAEGKGWWASGASSASERHDCG